MTWLTMRIVRHAKGVLVLYVCFLVLGGVVGLGTFAKLKFGGFWNATDEATIADAELDRHFPLGPPNLVLVVQAAQGVDHPEVRAAAERLTERISQEEGLSRAISYWTSGLDTLRSEDGRIGLIAVRILGDEDERKATLLRIHPQYHGSYDGLRVELAGQPAAEREATARVEEDLRRLELLATPVVLLILLLVFGSAVASAIPLAIGLGSTIGTLFLLRLLTSITDVNLYAVNVATALSLGLAVDYGLFMMTRYREELGRGVPIPVAVVRTSRTAGRTILFSAFTVALCLSSLAIFPLYSIRSLALAAIAVVVFAAASTVLVMPALLVVIGHRIDRFDIRKAAVRWIPVLKTRPAADGLPSLTDGRWYRFTTTVMRRPVLLGSAVIILLFIMAAPVLNARFVLPDETSLPRDGETARLARLLEAGFPTLSTDALYVVSPGRRLEIEELEGYAGRLSLVTGVGTVESAAGAFHGGRRGEEAGFANRRFQSPAASWFNLALEVHPQSEDAVAAVGAVREIVGDEGMLVGGISAHLVDTRRTVRGVLPWTVAIVVLSTLVVLILFTGSLVIPLKAIILNILGLAATCGALVWIFQEGRLTWLIGDYQVNGALELTSPIVLFCVAFGLSTDYELFLLSRIKEEWEAHGDNALAVARGLQRSGPVVTNAALVFVVVMMALVASPLGVVKLLGLGLGLAVFLDATLIRAVLVPSFMRLAGTANWWAPGWVVRLHRNVGLAEAGPDLDLPDDALPVGVGSVPHPIDAAGAGRLLQ